MARSKSGRKRRRTQIRQRQRRRKKRRKKEDKKRYGPDDDRDQPEIIYFRSLRSSPQQDNRCPYCGQIRGNILKDVYTTDKGTQALYQCSNCGRYFKPYVERVLYDSLETGRYGNRCPYCDSMDSKSERVHTEDADSKTLMRCSHCVRLFKPYGEEFRRRY